MKLDVLVFAAHPDDAELAIGGTIASLVKQHKKIGIVDLTKGEMGTRGTPESRQNEVIKATEILGINFRTNLDLGDSKLENSRSNQEEIMKVIRACQPDIAIIGADYDRHPDHGKATKLCKDAIFYSGLEKWQTKVDGHQQLPWRPKHILSYMQDRPFEPDFIFDISECWEIKKEAILAFDTQFNRENVGNEAETYISTPSYFQQIEARARYFGHLGGFEMGEAFQYINGPLGVQSLDFLNKTRPFS